MADGRDHVAGGGYDTQGGRGPLQNRPSGGGVEGGYGDPQPPPHNIHWIPWRTPWITGRLRYGDSLPRGQTDPAVNVHEVGGPIRNLYGPVQGVCRLGKGQIPVDPGGIWSMAAGLPHPPHLLVQTYDGGLRRYILQRDISRLSGGDSWGTTLPDHFQCGGGCGGAPLGIAGVGGRGISIRLGEGGAVLRHFILCGRQPDSVNQPQVAAGGIRHHQWVVRQGGDLD